LAVVDGCLFVVGEGDIGAHALQVGFGFEQVGLGGVFGDVKVAAGAGHPVGALLEERVAAVAMSQVIVLPGLAASGDGVAVDEDFDGAQVAGGVYPTSA
jgi:hypothetical protein